jgi:hypothetical protein
MKPRKMIVVNVNQFAETIHRSGEQSDDKVLIINQRREVTLEDGVGRVVMDLSPSEELPKIGDVLFIRVDRAAAEALP